MRKRVLHKRRPCLRRRRIVRTYASLEHVNHAMEQGWNDGYQAGHPLGYQFGRKRAIMAKYAAADALPVWNAHVLFVTTGMGVPYSPIDEAIAESLKKMVRKLHIAVPTANLLDLVKQERPDVLVVLNGMNFNVSYLEPIRALGVKTAVWLTDDPYYTDATIHFVTHYDYVFTLELSCVEFYKSIGCKHVHYLPFANDFRVYAPKLVEPAKRYDILFIGSGYWNRIGFFDSIAPYLATKNIMIAGWWWDRLHNYHLLSDKIQLGLWMTPEQTADYYSGAKIVINLHRAHDDDSYNKNSQGIPAHSINPRTFEIAGSGAFQLSDVRLDLSNYYTPGNEIATYESPEELVQKIEYYLQHEDERNEIARNSLRRTLIDHTYEKRLQTLLLVMLD